MRQPDGEADRGLFYAYLALVFWLPLPLGSNRPWSAALLEVWTFVLAAGVLWLWGRGRLQASASLRAAWPVLVLWALWLLYVALQTLPLPFDWLLAISPYSAEAYAFAAAGEVGRSPISVSVFDTRGAWLLSLALALLFVLTLQLAHSRQRLRMLAVTLVWAGLLQALYGSFMTLSGLEWSFFFEKEHGRRVATGTFVNRNHLAGYLVLTLAVGIGLMISTLDGGGAPITWRQRLRGWAALLLSPKLRLRVYLAIMVIALVLTRSRMGNTAFFASLLVAGGIGLLLSRHATRSTVVLLVSLIVIDTFIVGTWFGVEQVVERIQQTRLETEIRDDVDLYVIEQVKDYRWTGSGLGTFYAVFPRYRGHDVADFFDHVHNDYLEFAAEAGVVGMVLLGALVALTLLVALLSQARRRDPLLRGMSFACLMGMVGGGIHATVEFNLQIPAYAATFCVLLAMGWITHGYPRALQTGPAGRRRDRGTG